MAQRSSLVGTFSVLCGLAMVVLALAIGMILQGRIEDRALRGAEQLARTYTALAVVPNVTRADLAAPLAPAQAQALDTALGRIEGAGIGVRHAHVFGPDGLTVHSDDPARVGEVERGDDIRRALGGALVSDVERETGDHGEAVGTSLEVDVPLRLPAGTPSTGSRSSTSTTGRPPPPCGPTCAPSTCCSPAAWRSSSWRCSCSSTGSRAGCATRPSTTRSPGCRTGPRSTGASAARRARGAAARRDRPGCC